MDWKKKINKGLLFKIGKGLIGIGIIVLFIIIQTSWYPTGINGFYNRLLYFFSIPNNELAQSYFEKFLSAKSSGLDEISKEYLLSAWNANPNDLKLLDSLSVASFNIGDSEKVYDKYTHKLLHNRFFILSEEINDKILKEDPNNLDAKKRQSIIYYFSDKDDKAYRLAEEVLQEDPNNFFGLKMMCRKAYDSCNWKKLIVWSQKGINAYRLEAEFYYFSAEGLYELGLHKQAQSTYEDAVSLDPDHHLRKLFSSIPN